MAKVSVEGDYKLSKDGKKATITVSSDEPLTLKALCLALYSIIKQLGGE